MGLCHSNAADSPGARQVQPSIAQRCHTDALHSCQQWWAAGCKEPPRSVRQWVGPKSVAAMAASALRRHVVALGISAALSLDHLRLLRALPRLTALDVNVSLRGSDWATCLQSLANRREKRARVVRDSLPPRLCSLTLSCDGSILAPMLANQALVDGLAALADLRTLRLNTAAADLDLAPLLQLPLLSCLLLLHCPSLAQCSVLRRLDALTALHTNRCSWDRAALLELLRPPHALQQLQEI